MLNKRQDKILEIIDKAGQISISQILHEMKDDFTGVSRITINRDLLLLLDLGYINKAGKSRNIVYKLAFGFNLIKPVDIEDYFQIEVSQRKAKENFDFNIFSYLNRNIFSASEMDNLNKLNRVYHANMKKILPEVIKKDYERLTIELSWKSSRIEGNTYTLLETENLIKEMQEAEGRTKQEAIMILNHKKALDYILKNKKQFKAITIKDIEDIHYLLTQELGISRNIRNSIVRITGTKYKPLDNKFQIKEALQKTCEQINGINNVFCKALFLNLLIAYIQPFTDGNKRTSRLMGNAVLIANDSCPLSFRDIDVAEYKKAVLLFYEQNNLSYFKDLFIEQFEFAVNNYFQA